MLLYGGAALVALIVVLLGLWLIFGRRARRRRAHQRALRLLHQGNWHAALEAVRDLQALGPLSPHWEGCARNAEGECLRAAATAALAEKKYEESLQHYHAAAQLLNSSDAPDRTRVVEALLAEVYRLFAEGNLDATQKLLARLLLVQSPCAEASFWQALCFARSGSVELAVPALRTAHEEASKDFLDPPLYLGALLMRSGQSQEALRFLGEANRLDSSCPLVTWQLGSGMVTSGGDAGLATRALQRALGPKGLPLWARTPEKFWREVLPGPQRSFVSRLAAQQRFVCPVFGGDVAAMVRQGFLSLSQAQYRLGNYQETASICGNLLEESAPSLAILRSLGLALARLGRYDEAFKHLRAAHDQEDPKDALTAGYLALCGARGRPSKAEDKPNNVIWAIRLLGRFNIIGDREWADLNRVIFTEARSLNVPLTAADQVRCCDVLASVDAADPDAAATYDHLATTVPDALQPVHAWLYCRAAQQHGVRGRSDLALFALTFRHADGARGFYEKRKWDFDEVEATYLTRWAAQQPGSFPEALGTDYAAKGERLLLARAQQQEAAGQKDEALASAVTLVQLAPRSARAYDRWACLEHRRGDLEQAVRILSDWQSLHPADPWPLLRRAVLEQQRGNAESCTHALEQALQLTRGPFRAEIAFLSARLTLKNEAALPASKPVIRYLEICLRERPDHAGALWVLAALRWQAGDRQGLASQAAVMNRPQVKDARFHYLGAVCQLAADNYAGVLEVADRVVSEPSFAAEGQYLIGRAQLQRGDQGAALAALQKAAAVAATPSVQHARAVLGQVHFQCGAYGDAANWWKQVGPAQRAAWKLDDPLRATLFLAGVHAFESGQFEQAAERYREAGKLGYRERRLGPLLQLALFKAGQRALFNYRSSAATAAELDMEIRHSGEAAAVFLNQAIQVGCKDPAAAYLLALAYKRQGKWGEARTALRKIAEPDSNIWLQMGLLSLRERVLGQAEPEFLKAWELDPKSFPSGGNLLLTRLSLGQTEWAAMMAPQIAQLATAPEDKQLFGMLQSLLWNAHSGNGDAQPYSNLAAMTADDEQRLLKLIRSLGDLDTICLLLNTLETQRPDSVAARAAHFEAVLLKGKKLVDRCDWATAEQLLSVLVRQRDVAPPTLAALFNLVGCCACLNQDFDEGERYFSAAVRLNANDAGLHQNMALVHEWRKNLPQAEQHWNRYFDLLERRKTAQPLRADYFQQLAFDGLQRLAGCYSEKEKWGNALVHVERAQRLRPDDGDTLERLFHLYCQVRRQDDARRVLQQLRMLRPSAMQLELYELDLMELKDIDDVERWINEIGKIVQRHPDESRVEERALTMIGNIVPMLGKASDQLTDQINKVIRQVRSLQNYQVNWPAVHDVMRDLKREFQKLRKTVGKCLAVVTNPDLRRVLRDLGDHLDRKIEFCREWQGG